MQPKERKHSPATNKNFHKEFGKYFSCYPTISKRVHLRMLHDAVRHLAQVDPRTPWGHLPTSAINTVMTVMAEVLKSDDRDVLLNNIAGYMPVDVQLPIGMVAILEPYAKSQGVSLAWLLREKASEIMANLPEEVEDEG